MKLDELHRRAENLRARGRLEEAAGVYESVLRHDPEDERALRFVCCVRHLPRGPNARSPGLQMAPFAVIPDFLSVGARQRAFETLLAAEERFAPARVVYRSPQDPRRSIGGVETGVRESLAAPDLRGLISADWIEHFERAIDGCWRSMAAVVGVPHFEIGEFELQPTAYRDGGFFRRHHDMHSGTRRRITVLYQLHRNAEAFSGGELLLFDTDVASLQEGVPPTESARCTRLKARDNQLILFPSDYIHSVTKVRSLSSDFADSRFTITAWLHPRERALPAPAADARG